MVIARLSSMFQGDRGRPTAEVLPTCMTLDHHQVALAIDGPFPAQQSYTVEPCCTCSGLLMGLTTELGRRHFRVTSLPQRQLIQLSA